MSKGPLTRTVTVRNEQGLHLRPAGTLVKVASQFESTISISKGGSEDFDCKSILSLMTIGAAQGSELIVKADGPDAENALRAIEDLFNGGFDESSQTDAKTVDS